MPTYLIERYLKTLYMYNMDVGSNQTCSAASTMSSWHHFQSNVAQNCQNQTQLPWCNSIKVHLYANIPHWKVLNLVIYIHYGCGKQSKVVYSLNHVIVASFLLDKIAKIWPSFDCKGALLCLHTSLKGAKALYICTLWIWEAIKVVFSLNHDIMASFPLYSHPELPKSDPASSVSRCKGALICLYTSLKGEKILYIHPTWMCEAITGDLQPQPLHRGIISTRMSPRNAKIWPSFSFITV